MNTNNVGSHRDHRGHGEPLNLRVLCGFARGCVRFLSQASLVAASLGTRFGAIVVLCFVSSCAVVQKPSGGDACLFTSFRGGGENGLYLAYSNDGYKWTDLGGPFLAPKVGKEILMRDPCLLQGPDGTFHLVWTAGWDEKGIGCAHSKDLLNWSEEKYIEVMAHEVTAMNAWAPEIFYDKPNKRYIIYWSSTIPGRFPGDDEHPRKRNHRMYYATTRDFETFSETKLFFDPGYSVIDGIITKREKDYVLVLKDERPDMHRLRAAFSEDVLGPYGNISEPFTGFKTEGPSAIQIGDEWFVYFDVYGEKKYGAVKTKDFKSWTDVSEQMSFPKGHRHGTVLRIPAAVLETLKRNAKTEDSQSADFERRTQWFRDAKFGMFIHWGLYSVLAGEWQGRHLDRGKNGEWIMKFFRIPVAEYRALAKEFNPVKFNAKEWAGLAKEAGMRYLVITAKHHDGFALFDSDVSDYNIVDATPFKRDPMKELIAACRKEGLHFGFYYSHSEDWDHPHATRNKGNDWDYPDASKKDQEIYLRENAMPQMVELLRNYGRIDLMWFDRGIETREQGRRFYNKVRELQPDCLVNGRVGNYDQDLLGDYQCMNDNGIPPSGIEELWETPQTMNETWGYRKDDTNWKSSEEIIRRLVEIVSKGGNYLLNVGPTAEGVIPEESVQILREVGRWMSANGESIYGTTASPFADLSWGKCTVKGETLYLHVFDWPKNGRLKVPGLRNEPGKAYLLVDKKKSALPVVREGRSILISVGEKAVDPVASVVALEITGRPQVDPVVIEQGKDGVIALEYAAAITEGKTAKRFNRKGRFHISKWTGPEDSVSWHLNVNKAGLYDVEITYSAQKDWAGRQYTVTVGKEEITATVQDTGDWYEYKTFPLGKVRVPGAGEHVITIRPKENANDFLMYLQSAKLTPLSELTM